MVQAACLHHEALSASSFQGSARVVYRTTGAKPGKASTPFQPPGGTWDVPKFVAGHAEGSAGAGESGNAIVIGHVTSLTLGHVFEHLDGVSSGDVLSVFGADRRFDYRVREVRLLRNVVEEGAVHSDEDRARDNLLIRGDARPRRE